VDSFSAVRALAMEKRAALTTKAEDAPSLVATASKDAGYTIVPIDPDSPNLGGGDGSLSHNTKTIYVSNSLDEPMRAFVAAHELGHVAIETPDDPVIVPRGIDPGGPEEATPIGIRRVESYSPQERREQLANVFAREFLLPRQAAWRLFVDDALDASQIAKNLKLPLGLVHQQLATSLLLPASSETKPGTAKPAPALDSSQKEAAEHEGSPLLVEAGPGTGKTRTLVGRIEFLLGKGVAPSSILALTFSNRAAAEIRERIALTAPEAARELWAGTFHSFGLELLRKHGHLVDVGEPVRLLDQADQLALLEEDLLKLRLEYYLRLFEPLADLRHVLSAISRAKDELKTPDDYLKAAEYWKLRASDDDEALKAEKAIEVARVYAHYDRRMRGEKQVDFGDLISRPVGLFERHPEILAQTQAQYGHILVDEYQDVNRASAVLVKKLAGDGRRLWVVGDAKQSIYRFRGAAPINTRNFEKDYPAGVRKSLKINYRSFKQIVDAFGAYARSMRAVTISVGLEAIRGADQEAIDFNCASNLDAEVAGVAGEVRRFHANRIAFKDQAVLCRTHSQLEEVSRGLEAVGIPVLYLGDLFERPEVRDLLALVSFVSEPGRGGLLRVAELEPYRIPLADVREFLTQAKAADAKPSEHLKRLETVINISQPGRKGLARLAGDLEGVAYMTGPGTFLSRVLFDRGLVRPHLAGDAASDAQKRLAVHQLLQFAIENNKGKPGKDPKREMLNWIRRLESFGDERALREPPSAISNIDAVRLMTVHASKGLEFRAVHIPILGKTKFPLKWNGQRCEPPPLFYPTSAVDDHGEEEECLFFVALSRARDRLSLSRAQRYSEKQRCNASDALAVIGRHLPRAPDCQPTWTSGLPVGVDRATRPDLAVTAQEHDARDLEQYQRCARQYLYQRVLGLGGGREDNAYVQFHRAVYGTLRWIGEQKGAATRKTLTAAFEQAWLEIGPHKHPLAPLYRDVAERMLDLAFRRGSAGVEYHREFHLALGGASVKATIDEVERSGSGYVARRLRTGRKPKEPDHRLLHALMLEAARRSTSGAVQLQLHYLTGDASVPIPFDRVMASRLEAAAEILRDLAAGHFPPTTENRENCPRCPHYFICPSVPA
jgi:DNA helicase-2/ATP-dependent DNA helicase PcrA